MIKIKSFVSSRRRGEKKKKKKRTYPIIFNYLFLRHDQYSPPSFRKKKNKKIKKNKK